VTDTLARQVGKAEACRLEKWTTGPTRTRWTTLPLQVGDSAPSFDLVDQSGRATQLSSFWKERPAVVLFWRHYGCGCGLDRARRLREEWPEFMKRGAAVVIVGQGGPLRALAYAEKYALPPVSILSDDDGRVYEAYGLLEGRASQLLFDAPESWLDHDQETGVSFARERRAQGRPPVDNPWLLPGEFVIDRAGRVVLVYRYNYCEDFPDPRVLYAALREARA
jgi:peroxiredoxin